MARRGGLGRWRSSCRTSIDQDRREYRSFVVTHDATTRGGADVGVPLWQRMGLGVLAEHVPTSLVDQVLADTGRVQRRLRRLPARAVVWFVLALTLFHGQGYRSVWRELAHSGADDASTPSTPGLSQARRRVGSAPLAQLFTRLRGPQAAAGAAGAFLGALRLVSWRGGCWARWGRGCCCWATVTSPPTSCGAKLPGPGRTCCGGSRPAPCYPVSARSPTGPTWPSYPDPAPAAGWVFGYGSSSTPSPSRLPPRTGRVRPALSCSG